MATRGEEIPLALTYDDVLLVPAYSEVLPEETDVRTQLAPGLTLNIPILSAAMDTVTEYQMAIAMASEGGLGIIHKNLSIAEQAEQVRRVKRYESGLIVDPITLPPEAPVKEAFQLMAEHRIGGIPIVDKQRKLIGILTNRDIRFGVPDETPVSAYMTPAPLVTAPEGTSLEEAEALLRKHRIEKLPLVDKEGRLVGLITYKDILRRRTYPNACKDHLGRLRVGAAVGVGEEALARAEALVQAGVDLLTIDTAHGHSRRVIETLTLLRERYPRLLIMAGNIATAEAAEDLIRAGADIVKVGIGPGSICTTRVVTGVGMPQLSAILAVAAVTRPAGVGLVADGGIRYSGDITKALAAGADAVMLGSLLAGTEESPGETLLYEGRKFKVYRGMGSIEAMQAGSADRYAQERRKGGKFVPEGVVGRVPYRGSVAEVLYQLVGGLRAGMGYCGAATLEELRQARFVRISAASVAESHPHSLEIIREAPNYSIR
ncbi:MAG: IMP dehydrogenase [Bacteroidia bacterium]|jgi:IMP dehydrogenase|nr:IMP dehydrogenase [Bacteroidia bacterium]GIV23033.1 MAG: inosine-5'-monophosphate dehydrogenase [Bacteroidia bacterium]